MVESPNFDAQLSGHAYAGQVSSVAGNQNIYVHSDESGKVASRLFGAVPLEVYDFVDRPSLLEEIDGAGTRVVSAVHGIGGVGKSQLAARYFNEKQNEYDFAVWVDMRDQNGHADYQAIATSLNLDSEGSSPVDVVRNYIKGSTDTWLIVYDNTEHPQDLEPLLPQSQNVKAVITSRYRHWQGYAQAVNVDTFEPETASRYMAERAGRPNDPDCDALSEALGYLPLALSLAGSFCLQNQLSFRAYLTDHLSVALDPHNPHPDSSDHAIHQLWRQSLLAASAQHREVEDVARILSVLDWTSVDRSWFVAVYPRSEADVQAALATLFSFSLIELDERNISIKHNLIADGIAYATTSQLASTIVELFTNAVPEASETSADLVTVARFSEAIRHLQHIVSSHSQHVSADLVPILLWLMAQGNKQRSHVLDLAIAIVRMTEHLLGDDNAKTLEARHHLAMNYAHQGRYGDAVSIGEKNLVERSRILGVDHIDTIRSRHILGVVYRNLGRHNEARPLHKTNLEECIRILGPDHPETLRSRHGLGYTYFDMGRYHDALPLEEQNLADRKRILGADHPDTLHSRNNLALIYRKLGRHQDALSIEEENLSDRLRVLGAYHPDTFWSRHNLANTYRDVGRYSDALRIHQTNLQDRERILGVDHFATLASATSLAATLFAMGHTMKAAGYLDRVVKDSERMLGAEHPKTRARRRFLTIVQKQAETIEQGELTMDTEAFAVAAATIAGTGALEHVGAAVVDGASDTVADFRERLSRWLGVNDNEHAELIEALRKAESRQSELSIKALADAIVVATQKDPEGAQELAELIKELQPGAPSTEAIFSTSVSGNAQVGNITNIIGDQTIIE